MFDVNKFVDQYKDDKDAQEMAYHHVAEYCRKKNLDVCAFVNNDANIPTAAKEIHAGLPWAARMVVKADTIEKVVRANIGLIREVAAKKAGR